MSDEYAGPERRTPPPAQPVEISHLSNGARAFIEGMNQRISVMTKLQGWALAAGLPIGMAVAAGIWNMNGKIERIAADVQYRPTRPVIEEMIDERTKELRQKVIDTAAESEVAKELGSEGLNSLAASVEVLKAQQQGLRRDVDRIDRRTP